MPQYNFNFSVVWDNLPLFYYGVLQTTWLSVQTVVCGLFIGLGGAALQLYGGKWPRRLVKAWIEIQRNTPLIVQLFLVYFGLPELGWRLDANTAALIGMSLYLGAFATEIIRAGIESVPGGQIEAGRALGLSGRQIFRLIVLVPAVRAVSPALAAQFILIMLATSVVSTISADELTSMANGLQAETFRPFEIYLAVSVIYVAMALTLRGLLALATRGYVGRWQE